MDKLLLVDGHSILNRAYYGMPYLTAPTGEHTGGVFGFLGILFKIMEEEHPSGVIVAFDRKEPTFRHKMFEGYKGTRHPMPPELLEQVPLIKQVLTTMNITHVELPGYEADDLLGTLSRKGEAAGYAVTVLSGDRDLLQLATEHTLIRIPKTVKGNTEIFDYTPDDVVAEYGVTPREFIDVKALMGDTSDNIPGIPSVGPKTAGAIIAAFHSLENAYEHIEEVKPPKAREGLRVYYEQCLLSRKLATICLEAPIEVELSETGTDRMFNPESYNLFKRLNFRSYFKKFPESAKTAVAAGEEADSASSAEIEDVAPFICPNLTGIKAEVLSCNDETALKDTVEELNRTAEGISEGSAGEPTFDFFGPAPHVMTALSALTEDGALYGLLLLSYDQRKKETVLCRRLLFPSPIPRGERGALALQILSCLRVPLLVFDAKELSHYLTLPEGLIFDINLAAYLKNPLDNQLTYDKVWTDAAPSEPVLPSREELLGKLPLNAAIFTAQESMDRVMLLEAATCLMAYAPLAQHLRETGMDKLFTTIEMPTAFALGRMEEAGILTDETMLREFAASLSASIAKCEKEICEMAGEAFNINSPKQLGVILFEKLKLSGGKKTKTGYSTSAEILEKMVDEHPIILKILEYRQMTKLNSTYAEGLQQFIGSDRRIHSTFHQNVTATGRISSSDPNLQNIPTRTALGRELRKAFIAGEGNVLVDVDYSQIELRLLAHMSGDKQLITAYNGESAKDIHALTASWVFGVPLEEVTPELRRNAKAVNFGIVYGISAFGLSEDLAISQKEAAGYIKRYFSVYPGIKAYLDGLVKSAKETGYSVTLFGRRRPVPELNSSNFMQRQFGERIAMNSPIQGTAADVMKLAMLSVEKVLKKEVPEARIVLQIHDELLIETPADTADKVLKLTRAAMKQVVDYSVPLETSGEIGHSWYETK
ncbi:MAG: DNA polymerase I [Lachnospiraceae bacterium]|nr:DNA polymerase I [Lachnospiraceae bacterium]